MRESIQSFDPQTPKALGSVAEGKKDDLGEALWRNFKDNRAQVSSENLKEIRINRVASLDAS